MKKFLFAFPLLTLIAGGCTEDSNHPDKEEFTERNGKFLTVSILSPASLGSRADDLGSYEDGSKAENEVNLVRFYFFDKSGNPAPARKDANTNDYYSYIDWTPSNQGNTTTGSENIEKILTYNMTINHPADKGAPALIIAIINPNDEIKKLTEPKISDLNGLNNESCVADYLTGLTSEGSFVMSNSVFVDSEGDMVNASEIKKLYTTPEEAAEYPVKIYVERVVARVDFSISVNSAIINGVASNGIYDTGEKFNEQPIYVKFLGWQITSAPKKSRLMKYLNAEWDEENLFGNLLLWNSTEYHRSFWAMNPTLTSPTQSSTGDYTSFSYKELVNTGMTTMTRYTQENANPKDLTFSAPTTPTQIIIAAQLIDASGNPTTIAEYGGKKYTESGLLDLFAASLNLYSLTTGEDGSKTYTKIKPADLEIVTQSEFVQQAQKPDHFVDGSYFVYAVLNEDAAELDWYQRDNGTPNENGNYSYTQVQDVNKYIYNELFTYTPPMVWEKGHCYYYFNIRHLGKEGNPAYYGIVRNHLYKANLTKISGFGTPVYKDDEDIIKPEEPEYQEGMINAEIDILSWRIVDEEYELNWGDLDSSDQ